MAILYAMVLGADSIEDITFVEAEHREHAVIEQVIADLKDQALAHFPSGDLAVLPKPRDAGVIVVQGASRDVWASGG